VVVHVAVPGLPDVTAVVPQPVFPLHVTVPVTASGFPLAFRPLFTSPFCPLLVAVNVTVCPYTSDPRLVATVVVVVADPTVCPPLNVPVLPA
jgi:hypothetical protein